VIKPESGDQVASIARLVESGERGGEAATEEQV